MQVPVYEAIFTDNSELNYVSLVDVPAILKSWQAYSEQSIQLEVDKAQRIVSGPAIIADLPILRKENGSNYYIVYSAATIRKVVEDYAAKNRFNSVNLQHINSAVPEGVFLFESLIIDRARGVNPPEKFQHLTDGSWYTSYKINNEKVWADVESGKLTGFSWQGYFDLNPLDMIEEKYIQNLIQELTQ